MRADDFSRVEALFAEVLSLDPAARDSILDSACGERPDLRREVQALLEAHDRIGHDPDEQQAARQGIGVGSQLGAFRLTEKIGEGGMGAVFRAQRTDGAFTQEVAVKIMRSTLVDPDLLHRFKVERQILASLRHPNIVTLLDGGTTPDGQAFLVMEFVDGADIVRHCRDKALPLNERLQLFRVLCTAVQYAHQHGVVHRDLKPANILIGSNGGLKVLDFGVAKLLQGPVDGAVVTRGVLPGPLTPNYASPEQLRGLPVTTASDVYTLGIILYELVAGVRPYETHGLTLDRVLDLVVHTEPARPSSLAADRHLRGDIDAIVLKAISKEAAHRYDSAGEVGSDVARFLAGEPVLARGPSTGYVLRRLAARNKAAVAVSALALLGILSASAVAVWQARVARLERDRARAEAVKTSQVADFMREIFRSGSPSARRPSAEELLARGRERIAQLDSQPDVQSMLLLELGIAHRHLGLYDIGRDLLGRSVMLREQHYGPDAAETAQSLAEFGRQLRMAARYDEAQGALERALSIRERRLGSDHPDVAHSLDALAGVHWNRGRFDTAVSMVERAVAIMAASRPDDQDADRMRGNLGEALIAIDNYGRARTVYQDMLVHAERIGGPDGHNVAFAVLGIGKTLLRDERWGESRPYLERALRLMEQYYGENHASPAEVKTLLGEMHAGLGDRVAARRLLSEAVSTCERTLGLEHPGVADALMAQGKLLVADGDLKSANDVFHRAERIRTKAVGTETPQLAETLVELAQIDLAQGRAAAAQARLERALTIQRKTLVPRHRRLVVTLMRLADSLVAQGHTSDARTYLLEAVEIARAKLPPQHSHRSNAEAALARTD